MRNTVQLRLLGPTQIEQDGKPVTLFESRKAMALFCYLVLQEQPVLRSHLIDLFWGNKTETRGKGNLSRVLNSFTKLIPNCLQTDRHTVCFVQSHSLWVDVFMFRALVKEQNVVSLNAAVNLYQGAFMQGMYLDDCPEFETWVVSRQEHWRQQFTKALNDLVAHHLNRGDYTKTLDLTERLLEANSWSEEAHRLKMLVLALVGQRSEAMKQYETCKNVLKDELGVTPMEETTAVYERIRADAIVEIDEFIPYSNRLLDIPNNLPTSATPFLGRESESSKIKQQLSMPDCRLLTIIGMGGVGKTRLALQAAKQQIEHYPDGVYFMALASLQSSEFIVPALAQAIRFSFVSGEDPKSQLLKYIQNKELLLVMDNFDHLLDGVLIVAEILRAAPRVKLLVTSRERLLLSEEWIMELKGLSTPGESDQEIEHYESVRLFLQNAQKVHEGFILYPEDKQYVTRICRLLDGLPLGIELASSWIRTLSCQTIAQEVENNVNALTTMLKELPEKHRSLKATFDYSWFLLSEESQTIFSKLSVFRGGFELDAALHVAGASLTELTALMDKSLLSRNSSGRYVMHELLHQYGQEKLMEDRSTKERCHEAHLRYYFEYLKLRKEQLQGDFPKQMLEEIAMELDNFFVSFRWAIQQENDMQMLEPLECMYHYFGIAGKFHEGIAFFETLVNDIQEKRATDGIPDHIQLIQGRLLLGHGFFLERIHEYIQAKTLLRQSLKVFEIVNDRASIARATRSLGNVEEHLGEFSRAKKLYQHSLELCEELNNHSGVMKCLNNLGIIFVNEGDLVKAKHYFEKSLTKSELLKNRFEAARAFLNLGMVMQFMDDFPEAKDYYNKSIKIYDELGYQWGVANCLSNLGVIAADLEEYEEANTLHHEALSKRKALNDRWGIAASLNNLGDTCVCLGELAKAQQWYLSALQHVTKVQAPSLTLDILVAIAGLMIKRNLNMKAARILRFSLNHSAIDSQVKSRAEQFFAEIEHTLVNSKLELSGQNEEPENLDRIVKDVILELKNIS